MGAGISGLLVAVGAAVALAVHATVFGFNVHLVGVILMVAGGMGLLTVLAAWGSGRPLNPAEPGRRGGALGVHAGDDRQELMPEQAQAAV